MDSSGDLVFHNGTLTQEYTTQPFTQVVAQRLVIRLRTWETEWFLDTEYGVPYFDIIGRKVPKSRVDSILQQEILAERGVKEIVSFTSTLQNRQYSASFRVKVSTGETTDVITITPTS
jgi:hypothetical protein